MVCLCLNSGLITIIVPERRGEGGEAHCNLPARVEGKESERRRRHGVSRGGLPTPGWWLTEKPYPMTGGPSPGGQADARRVGWRRQGNPYYPPSTFSGGPSVVAVVM